MSLYKFHKKVFIHGLIGLIFFFVIFPLNVSFADFDIDSYSTPIGDVASPPKELIHPEYLLERNKLTWKNIKRCLTIRYEFIFGIRPDVRNEKCYRIQRRINKALNKLRENDLSIKIARLDDKLVFSKQSPLSDYRPPRKKTTLFCHYLSCGDLRKDGFIYCDYHGVKYGSKVYKRYKKLIDASTNVITPDDLIDILMLMFFLLVPIISWFILKKILNAPTRKLARKK